ncbi:hypothetical protein KAT51_06055 [bacterium]|nr:hypothetical protein [bacterium]
MREKNLCDKCKKEIEHPSYFSLCITFIYTIILLSIISVGLILGVRAIDIFSTGERIIIMFLSFLFTFGFFLYPNKIEDLKKLYKLPIMKKYEKIGNLYYCPYLLIYIYYGIVIMSIGKTNLSFLLTLSGLIFILLIGFPLFCETIEYIKKRKKK